MLVFFFFFLTRFLSARFKVFHWERKFCLFLISAVFSILEVYMDLNSVLLVFCFCFCFLFSFFLGDKHGCLISEISTWWDFFFVSKVSFEFQALCCEDTLRTFSSEGHFPGPPTGAMRMRKPFLNGQCSARYPCLLHPHTRPPHVKRKKIEKKSLRNHVAI